MVSALRPQARRALMTRVVNLTMEYGCNYIPFGKTSQLIQYSLEFQTQNIQYSPHVPQNSLLLLLLQYFIFFDNNLTVTLAIKIIKEHMCHTQYLYPTTSTLFPSLRTSLPLKFRIITMLQESIQIEGVRYEICGEIGEGGVGHVFIVREQCGRKWALKVIKQYGRNPVIREMVEQEIKMQERFSSNPHIIQLVAHRELLKRMFILFELGTCSLRNRMTMPSHLPLNEFIDIALDLTKGLAAIHAQNLIHRDIKPENIICVERTYKITDFGSLQEGRHGEERIGTPLYLPPEMLQEQECRYDQKIDVWSLGVSLFEAYFRIHPFYYGKDEAPVRQVYRDMKANIAALTPKFTFARLLAHLEDQRIPKEATDSIRNKILVTPEAILDQFQYFFAEAKERPDIEYFAAVFQSLEQSIRDSQVKTSRLAVKQEELPSDMRFYIDTLNLFYELCARYGNEKMNDIEFHIELGLWYWNYYNYLGEKYVVYAQGERLKAYKKDRETLWSEVQSTLFDYWLEISSNEELSFFPDLQQLKLRVLICGARFKIYKGLDKFMEKVTKRVGMDVKHLEELETMLAIFEVAQLKAIEDILVSDYF